MEFYLDLKKKLDEIIKKHNFKEEEVYITTKALTPEEAIGITKRKDFPLLNGREVLVNAEFKGDIGQAYTDSPAAFRGTLKEIMELDLSSNYNKALFIASLNAVMKHLNLADRTIHCKDNEPEECGEKMREYFLNHHKGENIALIGLQPAILDYLKDDFNIRVLDLDVEKVGTIQYGVNIEHGIKDYENVIEWADIILATGSTSANGSMENFTKLNKKVYFYGTTIAGIGELYNLNRLCFCSK
ncbi:DUF364 domain-containing protein [Clostridium sp.]|uniref:Rossmann-like domain-containing protein n=1 Tax=Clostridium sp. TaxID=1506 RepID=UPI003464C43B